MSSSSSSSAGVTFLSSPVNGSDCKKWDLTAYELEREPQEVITDHDVRMALHPECLRNDFMCPICLKLQSNSVTVMGCLHRFCRECIIKALSNTSKECPVCRTRLPNKRYLRPDPNFDMLISRIFPLREEDLDDMTDTGSGAKIRTRQNTRRLRTMRFARDASPDTSSPEKSSDGSPNSSNGLISEKSLAPIQDELEVILKPLAEVISDSENWLNQTRYIKVPSIATVDHLIKYLNIRFKQESQLNGSADGVDEPDESLFTLCFASGPGQFQPVLNGQLLRDIKDAFFKGDRPLELHYAYNITTSSGVTETDDKRIIPDGFDMCI